jgi:hypothetical protein
VKRPGPPVVPPKLAMPVELVAEWTPSATTTAMATNTTTFNGVGHDRFFREGVAGDVDLIVASDAEGHGTRCSNVDRTPTPPRRWGVMPKRPARQHRDRRRAERADRLLAEVAGVLRYDSLHPSDWLLSVSGRLSRAAGSGQKRITSLLKSDSNGQSSPPSGAWRKRGLSRCAGVGSVVAPSRYQMSGS